MIQKRKINLAKTLKIVFFCLALILAVMHIFSVLYDNSIHTAFSNDLLKWFDLDQESNVPTVYSGLLLGCCAFISLLLAVQKNLVFEKIRWVFLSLLFFYLAFDELLVIHETFAEPIRNALSISNGNFFYHAWVIPAIVIAGLFAAASIIINSRDKVSRLQKRIFLYIALLAGGVIFLEMTGTKVYFSTVAYKLGPVLLEEMYEVFMSSLILYTLTISAYSTQTK